MTETPVNFLIEPRTGTTSWSGAPLHMHVQPETGNRAFDQTQEMSCPHLSVPVEMDESMTSSSLDIAWPLCQQCLAHTDDLTEGWPAPGAIGVVVGGDYPQSFSGGHATGSKGTQHLHLRATPPSCSPPAGLRSYLSKSPVVHSAGLPRRSLRDDSCGILSATFPPTHHPGPGRAWNPPSEDEESLEPAMSLRSNGSASERDRVRPTLLPAQDIFEAGHTQFPRRLWQHPPEPRRYNYHVPAHHAPEYQQNAHIRRSPPKPVVPMAMPQATVPPCPAPGRDLMTKVCLHPSQPINTGQAPFQEITRTISLPDNCRNVFITYSVDTAEEMIPFVKFLISHGFKPAIDIFDHAVQQMDMNKWMDSYLKDKSVLIVVAISPKYKVDVEGDGCDQHGLHTKYIYTQIQNEFIQQRCLNFRLVPVLFPNANQTHVPMWLQSTRLFHWPQDAQDLLLRLLREERYIPPPLSKELTLIIKPL